MPYTKRIREKGAKQEPTAVLEMLRRIYMEDLRGDSAGVDHCRMNEYSNYVVRNRQGTVEVLIPRSVVDDYTGKGPGKARAKALLICELSDLKLKLSFGEMARR